MTVVQFALLYKKKYGILEKKMKKCSSCVTEKKYYNSIYYFCQHSADKSEDCFNSVRWRVIVFKYKDSLKKKEWHKTSQSVVQSISCPVSQLSSQLVVQWVSWPVNHYVNYWDGKLFEIRAYGIVWKYKTWYKNQFSEE